MKITTIPYKTEVGKRPRPKARKTVSFLLFALAYIVSACSTPIQPVAEKVLIPLQVGELRVYQTVEPRFATPSIIDTTSFYAIYIDRDTTIQGEQWFISAGGSVERNRSDGYYYWDKITNKAVLSYKFPATKGDMYSVPRTLSGRDTLVTRTVTETALSVVVPTGTYSCYQYKTPFIPITTRSFAPAAEINIAPDVGIVKSSFFRENGSLFWWNELIARYPPGEGAKRRIVARWTGAATETIFGTTVTQALVDVTIQNEQNGALSGIGTLNPLPGTAFQPDAAPVTGTFASPMVTIMVEEPTRFRNKGTIRGTLSSDMSRIEGTMTTNNTLKEWKITLQRKR